MSSARWRFSSDELGVLWPLVGPYRLPFPFRIRAGARTVDAQRALDRTCRERLTAGGVLRGDRVDPDVESALLTLARPQASVDAVGFFGPRPPDVVRVLASLAGTAAVVGVQLPGTEEHVGGDLVVETVPAGMIASAVARSLPSCRPGRHDPVHVSAADLRPRSSGTISESAGQSRTERAREAAEKLVQGPFDGAGQISTQLAREGAPPLRTLAVRWFDRPGDGRYVIVDGSPASGGGVTVRPGDPSTVAGELQERVAVLGAGR